MCETQGGNSQCRGRTMQQHVCQAYFHSGVKGNRARVGVSDDDPGVFAIVAYPRLA